MFSAKRYLGLDLGTTGPKAVVLERAGKGVRLLSCRRLDNVAEGILNERELYQDIGVWLQESGWQKLPCCLGLPQYQASTLLADFPSGKRVELARMVAHETRQLAGVSDEVFVSDYHPFLSAGRGGTAVLIGISREQAVSERMRLFEEVCGGCLESVAMNGLALVNALCELVPSRRQSPEPVLLLDLGQETCTAVIWCGGRPLFLGTLLFACDRFHQAVQKKRPGVVLGDGVEGLGQINLNEESSGSPLLEAARQLEGEVHNVVEHWRSQEGEALARTPVAEVYLSGGGSRIGGLREWLQRRLEVPVTLYGPEVDGRCDPDYVVAYGLACQASGVGAVPVALLPAAWRWQRLRQRRLPWLAAGVTLLALTATLVQWRVWERAGVLLQERAETIRQMQASAALIPELDRMTRMLAEHEARVLPLAAAGNRTLKLRQALQALAASVGEQDWFIYLGDEQRYLPPTTGGATASGGGRRVETAALFAVAAPSGPVAEFSRRLSPADAWISRAFVAIGYTPAVSSQPYEQIREIKGRLDGQGCFAGVDLLPESGRISREDIFAVWNGTLRRQPRQSFKTFTFRLPLSPPVLQRDREAVRPAEGDSD